MRKIIPLIMGVLISLSFQISAKKNNVPMDSSPKRHGDNNIRHRSPLLIPIEVNYDDETHLVEISGDEELDAQVYLCDEHGNVLDYSPALNSELEIPDFHSGMVIIRVESEDWISTGSIFI